MKTWLQYCNRRLFIVLLLGFSSGLPLALIGGTLQAWYTVSGVDIVTIGMLSLIGQPYAYKFIWSPLMDRYSIPLLGRRRGWILLSQLSLIAIFCVMAFMHPEQHPFEMAVVACVAAFLAASQDIVIDAYRTDILPDDELGLGAAVAVSGYRIAMITSGSIALILADIIGWHETYLVMAACMSVGIIANILAPEPEYAETAPMSLHQAVIAPFKDFLARPQAVAILIFIVLYKFSESFSTTTGPLTTAFLLDGLGFSLTTVGTVNKGIGLAASLLGSLMAGVMLTRISLYRALMGFGLFQAVANSGFIALAIVGKHYSLFVTVVFIDNFSYGLGSTAIVAYIMSLCNKSYSATQFALLSSIAAMGRIFIGPFGGLLVKYTSWVDFFVWSVIILIPALMMLRWLNKQPHAFSSPPG